MDRTWGQKHATVDLREILQEKAAGHREFYRKLRAEGSDHNHNKLGFHCSTKCSNEREGINIWSHKKQEKSDSAIQSENLVDNLINSGDTVNGKDKLEETDHDNVCPTRSKMILEAQYSEMSSSWEDDDAPRVRIVRTPSVVVSDYSNEISGGITLRELEYLQKRVSSIDDGDILGEEGTMSNN